MPTTCEGLKSKDMTTQSRTQNDSRRPGEMLASEPSQSGVGNRGDRFAKGNYRRYFAWQAAGSIGMLNKLLLFFSSHCASHKQAAFTPKLNQQSAGTHAMKRL